MDKENFFSSLFLRKKKSISESYLKEMQKITPKKE